MERFDYQTLVQAGACWATEDMDKEELASREAEEREYIPCHYAALRDYFLEAANAGDAMLLWIE
jgi:hypothetical protein